MRTRRIGTTLGVLVLCAALAFLGCRQKTEQDLTAQSSGFKIIVPTYAATDVPGIVVDNKSAGSESIVIEDAGTRIAAFGGTGALDMGAKVIANIGNAGTDFASTGGLTLANALVVTTGGIDVQAGSITLANDETISNGTDGVIDISAFFAFAEAGVVQVTAGGTITPVGTYQPITSSAALSTTWAGDAINDGTKNGQLLILCNENAADAITVCDSTNTRLGGDKVLTGGQGDCLTVLWDGAWWVAIGYNDN